MHKHALVGGQCAPNNNTPGLTRKDFASQKKLLLVYIAFLREAHRRRFVVSPFDESNGRTTCDQSIDISFRPAKISLDANPDVGIRLARAPKKLERRRDVRALFHVNPQDPIRWRTSKKVAEIRKAVIGVEIQAKLCELDR